MARADGEACVQVFFIRGGKLIGRDYFLMEGAEDMPDANVMAEFLQAVLRPGAQRSRRRCCCRRRSRRRRSSANGCSQKRGGNKVEILVPHEGPAAGAGRRWRLRTPPRPCVALQAQWEADTHRQEQALAELQAGPAACLRRPTASNAIDISNTQGTAAVGSMVVFEQGVPEEEHYRRFNIRSVSGPDDFASMEEVLDPALQPLAGSAGAGSRSRARS